MFKKTSLTILLAASLSSSLIIAQETTSAAKSSATSSAAQDWIVLFDGSSLDAWRNYKQDSVSDGWKIVDGALTRVGKAGDIITKEEFGAFELKLEFKISPAGNSGVIYHVQETASTPWQTGPEIQIQDNVAGHDPQKCGWLYQLYPAQTDATKPAGQWNELRVIITPEKCEHYMNGVKYCEYVKGSDEWNKKVAASKFAKFEGFGKSTSGHICLQDHNDEVAYRNIQIRKLD